MPQPLHHPLNNGADSLSLRLRHEPFLLRDMGAGGWLVDPLRFVPIDIPEGSISAVSIPCPAIPSEGASPSGAGVKDDPNSVHIGASA